MSCDTDGIVKAVQESVKNLVGLIDQATRGRSPEEIEGLKEAARRTVCMMVAAIVTADKKYAEGERAFLNLLVDWGQGPGGEVRFLSEYACAWKTACMEVPGFFQAAVDHDRRLHTELARAMMQEMELIGNNTCVSDGEFEAAEHDLLRDYMHLLEGFLMDRSGRNAGLPEDAAEGWTSV